MRELSTMNRRPGVSLMEVLVAMFVMAVGMLALLVLFPLGALSMAQALRDDRAATCAQIATAHANALDIRHDPNVTALFTLSPTRPVYVDPLYVNLGQGTVAGAIPRTALSAGSPVSAANGPARFLSLLDDITFADNGTPDLSGGGGIARAGVWSWCYMLRPMSSSPISLVDMSVVVYRGRSVQLAAGETAFAAAPVLPNGLLLSYPAGNPPPIRPGSWILDTTSYPTNNGAPYGYFYRVVNTNDQGGSPGQFVVEVQGNLLASLPSSPVIPFPMQIVAMENVIEVFPRGTN